MPKSYYENYNIIQSYKRLIIGVALTMNTSLPYSILNAEVNSMIDLEMRLAKVNFCCFILKYICLETGRFSYWIKLEVFANY